jgi:hypothetical protein
MRFDVKCTCPFSLLVAITFHYSEKRLRYLFETIRGVASIPVERIRVVVCTNTGDPASLSHIRSLCGPLLANAPWRASDAGSLLLESHLDLDDPWNLPWCHKHLIIDTFLADGSPYTHFVYMEDDILCSVGNLLYFTQYVDVLRPHGLIPAFQRVEYNKSLNELRLLDQTGVSHFEGRARIRKDEFTFVNPDYPYQAMFMLDKTLAEEYAQSRSFDRVRSVEVRPAWGIGERAAMGLCFESIPEGYWSRYVIPVDVDNLRTPSWSWIYHLPNNYTGNQRVPHGKTRPELQFSAGPAAYTWRPPSRLDDVLWHLRQLPTRVLRGRRNTGHDLVPPGLCGLCGEQPPASGRCPRPGCPFAGRMNPTSKGTGIGL